jgi:LuxR family maltose regulon positive regulatory protein
VSGAGAAARQVPLDEAPREFHRGFVRRPRLIKLLTGARDASLALITGPPGYGKSSLLAEWAERDERPFVWVELDNCDKRGPRVADVPISRLMRAVRSHSECVVVVDHADLIAPRALRDLVEAILDGLPDRRSLIALASRTAPALPLGRLRAHRALVEINTDDLAMVPAEAATLLRRSGLQVEFDAVQTLVRETEGWPAALYLASLSLAEASDQETAVSAFAGDDHLIAQYLQDEVLGALSPELMSFAVRTSVLPEVSGPICDAVLGERGSAIMLARLAGATPLFIALDPAHERYRWHRLVRQTLLAELRRTESELKTRLHRRASFWHSSNGNADHAINHAVAAGDAELTGDLLWSKVPTYVAQGGNDHVQRWLRGFSADRIADYAPLALSAAHSSLAGGDLVQAQHWALAARSALHRGRAAPGTPSLGTGLDVIEAMGARAGLDVMASAATRAYESEPADSPWRPICSYLRGAALHLAGERCEAATVLEEGADVGVATAPTVASMCLAQRAMIAIEDGDWQAAIDLTDEAQASIAERGLERIPMSALAFAAAAAARAHEGRADEAKADLRVAAELLAALGEFVPWYGAAARIMLAHASLWLADTVGARTLLAEASRLARKTPGAVIFTQWFDDAWAYMDTLAETSLAGPSALTIAELRVLRFLPSHRSFREIALQLGVSANTVKTQAHAVYRKLGAESRSDAVNRALEAGLLGQ